MADQPVIENPIILNLMDTYGPILIGSLISCALYGMGCLQLFLYFNHYDRDSLWMKCCVVLVWAFETASVLCNLVAMWPALILKWGSIHELGLTQLPMVHRIWVIGVETFLVHMFYIYRIYIVSGSRPLLPALLIPFTLYQMIEGIVYASTALENHALSSLSEHVLTGLGVSGRAVIAFVDIAIGALMIHALLKDGFPQFKSTRAIVNKVIVLTVNTGLWTAVLAIVDLILIAKYPTKLYFTAVDFPLSSLYINSLMANLNAREYIRGKSSDTEHSYQFSEASRTAAFRSRTMQQGEEFHIRTGTSSTQVGFDSEDGKPTPF